LERAFLAAGVPGVVSSLWEVDDQSTVELFFRFHQKLEEGVRVPEALRSAQLNFLHHLKAESSSSVWSGFRAIGGFSF
jgi:CHAT domain-containing protein